MEEHFEKDLILFVVSRLVSDFLDVAGSERIFPIVAGGFVLDFQEEGFWGGLDGDYIIDLGDRG